MKYTVFYKDTEIGVLEINDHGQHRYIPQLRGVELVKEEVALPHEMLKESEWRSPIPFFKNRIENASRFNLQSEIMYHTDCFRMVKVDP